MACSREFDEYAARFDAADPIGMPNSAPRARAGVAPGGPFHHAQPAQSSLTVLANAADPRSLTDLNESAASPLSLVACGCQPDAFQWLQSSVVAPRQLVGLCLLATLPPSYATTLPLPCSPNLIRPFYSHLLRILPYSLLG